MQTITMRAALERIERMTRGYYYLSTQGMMHAFAAAALRLPLTDEEKKLIRAEVNAGKLT